MTTSKRRLFTGEKLFSKVHLWGVLLGITVGVLLSLARAGGLFSTIQLRSTDFLYGDIPPGDTIIIVTIDDASIAQLGPWPWPYATHAQFIESLSQASALGVDILFEEYGDFSLVEATKQTGNVVYPILGVLPNKAAPGIMQAQMFIEPPVPLQNAAVGVGIVNVLPDADGVARRLPLLVQHNNRVVEAMSLQILRHYLSLPPTPPGKLENGYIRADSLLIPVDYWGNMNINFVGEPDAFPTYAYIDVLTGAVPPSAFQDKIVLVGQMGMTGGGDIHLTPTSRGGRPMSGVEIQANVIHTILHHRFLQKQPLLNDIIIILGIALFSGLFLPRLRVFWGSLVMLLMGAGYWLYAFYIFNRGQIPDLLYPTLSLAFSYIAVMIGGFVLESRHRRHVTALFGRYVPPAVVNEILADPEAMELGAAREQEITVLFTDIRNFTTFSEKTKPRQIVEILNQYLNQMTEAIFAYGGTVDKFTGDGLMALFNAPLPQTDHVLQAVQAALTMQNKAISLDASVGEPLRYGIGIHTGYAIVGNIGSRQRLEYTAIGDTVNTTARLQGLAKGGQVLISQAACEQVKGRVRVQEMGAVKVKGRQESVQVYRVLSLTGDTKSISLDD
ncbi:MAG TPA: adenylate/guanylate cyclase domain-containing protein [Chloroflexi bacterium]|nr:MAG: hypothetical protein B6243_04625 [Anaerolineaceae bacterium 4572_5.2]HEY84416.1 adenylate/guanylate cyclase domain-containing protein [Chloroflexota bacterium]